MTVSDEAAEFTAPLPPELVNVLSRYVPASQFRDNLLANAAAFPETRAAIDAEIDRMCSRSVKNIKPEKVIVIGAGLHAAIFCAAYFKRTGKRPVVLEANQRIGGVFALCRRPAFYLNSRNRPEGAPGGPGTMGPLNSIGGSFELSDISYQEYPPQNDLAYVIRCTLAQYARPFTSVRAGSIIRRNSGNLDIGVSSRSRNSLRAENIVIATGVPSQSPQRGVRFTFESFLQALDRFEQPASRFGKRIAVIGAGDSAACVIEFLLGQGPPTGYDSASSTFPERIAWFGQKCQTREEYVAGARSRYAGIGRYMPRFNDPSYYARVIPYPRSVGIRPDGSVLYRDADLEVQAAGSFDSIIACDGVRVEDRSFIRAAEELYRVDDIICGTRYAGTNVFKVGPCSNLPISEMEKEENKILAKVPQNSVALFRYNRRTQLVARSLV